MGSTKVQAPPPRDYYKEATDTIRAQVDMAPIIMDAERRIVPQMQAMQMEQMLGQSKNLLSFYGQVMDPFSRLAGQYAESMNKNTMEPLARSSRLAYEAGLGGGAGIQDRLRSQAFGDLDAGFSLTPEMNTLATQMARAGATQRGMAGGNYGVMSEVLNGYQMAQGRQDRARTFAGAVLGSDQNIASQSYAQYGSPMMTGIMQGFSPTGIAGNAMGMNTNLGPSYIKPESQMAQNIYANNYNAELQARTATAANKASMTGAIIGGVGSALGGTNWKG